MTGNVTTEPTIRCAVIGQPVAHSKSPGIHRVFAAQFGLPLAYERIDCAPADFVSTVHAFFAAGGRGLNVTLPHKMAALIVATTASEGAQAAGAANTLGVDGSGAIWADNTDGIGLVRDLQRLGISVRDQRVLVLGAGGAAAGILPSLLAEAPALLALSNRSVERARSVLARWPANTVQLATAHDAPYDVVISTVSDGAAALLATLPVQPGASGYDLNYGERAAVTLAAMRERGLSNCHDGRGMLIEQAAESFQRWHGLRPDTGALHAGAVNASV